MQNILLPFSFIKERNNTLCVVTLAVVIMSSLFAPKIGHWRFETGHNILFIGMCCATGFFLLYHIFSGKQLAISLPDLFMGAFVALLFTSLFKGNILPTVSFILAVVFAYTFNRTISGKDYVLFIITLLNILLLSYLVLDTKVADNRGITGPFSNAAYLSGLLMICIPVNIGCVWLCDKRQYIFKCFFLILAIANLYVIVYNQTRSSILALVLGGVFLGVKRIRKKYRYIVLLLAGLLVSFLLAYLFKTDSTSGRLLILKITALHLPEVPVIGFGYGSFQHQYLDWQSSYFSEQYQFTREASLADFVEYAFNEWLQLYCELGIAGFVLMTGLIILACKAPVITRTDSIVRISFFILCINCCFTYSLHNLPILLIFVMLLQSCFSNLSASNLSNAILTRILSIGIIILLIKAGSFYVSNYKAIHLWKKGYESTYGNSIPLAMKNYEAAYPVLQNEAEYLYNYATESLKIQEVKRSTFLLERAKKILNTPDICNQLGYCYQLEKQYNSAEEIFLYSSNAVPNRFIPRCLLMDLYLEKRDTVSVRKIAAQILALPVKINSGYVEVIRQKARRLIN
ncbi:O-antigen ligase family protein [Chitinophaga sp. RAB17]|uniref:O-antigen ligase family protein n=1 Tax=Chitinophaga sp. RAB17 TaxID=3233049 RepID=UPI003F928C18